MVTADPVVTGMAWSTPLGRDLAEVWDRLCAGETGVTVVPSRHRLRADLAATLADPPYGRKPGERMVDLATEVLSEAAAGLDLSDPRIGLVLGTSFGALLETDDPADWCREVARRVGAAHPPVMVSTACSTGTDTLLAAQALMRSGRLRACVTGAVDILTEAKRLGHSVLATMSPTALRAFDSDHDGTMLGEGAAFLVLESASSARARGARVHATLRGSGSANDAYGLTAPDPTGSSVITTLRRCLAAAGLSPDQVAVVSAHGTGTPLNDEVEARSLAEFFGVSGPVVFATKGALGHSLGATGAIEAIGTILALKQRRVPPVANLTDPVPSLNLPGDKGAAIKGGIGLSLTLGFGGFNTCLAFERQDAR
ncbi:beta-ketoacyl-[acyl-carrier-protein] synthase family protein [Thermomonospora umbrina]|uniref:3-oxoacyl-[acyl-carrier-protein] synthase II n=1 Tax=Thermomonospora umbrina TaxID=111806 RepID=A0A3D9SXW6_9ACTN|nr:beta-ketoacyl-[acyl-carrier-protein] synthase family protein [Thermomonospora umbrina]REF00408.1 3-oxoacyl-[acyl-carrier-protein] synthase II [Thermomonospora umbrina]